MVAVRVTSELHKLFSPRSPHVALQFSLESPAVAFVSAVTTLFASSDKALAHTFNGAAFSPESALDEAAARPPTPAGCSLRLLESLTLPVMHLLQLYPHVVAPLLLSLLPAMMAFVATPGPEPESVPPASYGELRAAQVKCVSFVTFLTVRSLAEVLQPHMPRLSQATVHLLRSCPESVSSRRVLLAATKHLMQCPPLRFFFLSHADALLDEKLLLGGYRAAQEALRPSALALICELVAATPQPLPQGGARPFPPSPPLTLPQLRKAALLALSTLRDPSSPIHTCSAALKLLLIITDALFANRFRLDPSVRSQAAAVQQIAFLGITDKLCAMRRTAPGVVRAAQLAKAKHDTDEAAQRSSISGGWAGPPPKVALPSPAGVETAASFEIYRWGVCGSPAKPLPDAAKELAESKTLLKTLLTATKQVAWSMTHFSPAQSADGAVERVAGPAAALGGEAVDALCRVLVSAPRSVACLYGLGEAEAEAEKERPPGRLRRSGRLWMR